MAKYGISGVIGGGSAEGGAVERHMIGFQAAYARRGVKLELGERLALGYQFHIASSREQAIREAAPHYEENMKMFGELRLVRALTDEQIAAMRDPKLAGTVKLPTIEDAVKAGGFLAGRPEDIIEALKAVEKRYPGLDRVICATPLGTPLDIQLADLDRFAKEVIPAFRDTRTAAAAQQARGSASRDRDEAFATVRELSRCATYLRQWGEFPRFGGAVVTVRLKEPERSVGQGCRAGWPPDIGAFVQQPNVNHRLSIGILMHRHANFLRFGRRRPPTGRSAG